MKKRILSMVCILVVLCVMSFTTVINAKAENTNLKRVDGSYLTHDDESSGATYTNDLLRGKHLMDGDSIISKAGKGKIYAYGETTANHDVDYVAVIVYVERYLKDLDKWAQVDAWSVKDYNTYFVVTAKTLKVEGGYYYRVRSDHFAGNEEDYPYDTAFSLTDGIWIE